MLKKVFRFYIDSFSNMGKYPKRLALIIAIKLVIMFGILKVFFFQDYLSERYDTDKQKSEHVINQLTNP
ncbi:MAG: DUF4492 domain-containing protein [Bacteroidales bacterium]|nr:DUF4492 domain-containing protein [Bacteroidales bacterium]